MDEACAMLTMTLWETATGTGRRAMRRKELIKAVPISGPPAANMRADKDSEKHQQAAV
jgi:hypothetical protein